MPLLYDLTKLTVGATLRLGWRPRVEGLEHLPRHGGAILAGNHLSVADELFLVCAAPRHVTFWAKVEYFNGRGPGGWLNRGRTGMTRLARDAGVPIVPVGALGTAEVLPVDARWPRRHPVTLRFGPPIPVAGRINGPRDIRTFTDEVMAAIQRLTGQEYVPRYAPRRAEPTG
ncbi:1-acyl-sn-glycerol-3-phosphate acyltransferase [Micromonospora sp. RHAY321]|uniref:lysophospholipid acyltransferase family protein n=1 Tax=Micromonospora sp. RHAY321 TaxID=2944807 RepID=UPI00207D242E|nr:lysophospholipid acyltransferase family protein [Micromonospora sp. RHAY321]MCO1599050.1 1-acyl-sn-glycerol-3-phosphate acyltransferase [Micromonospora sp. RHAY321]